MWRAGQPRSLVIVGRRGWVDVDIVRTIEASPYYGDKLFWFSDIDDVDLGFAYEHCHALIFSSIAEGFGIPMIEAASYGKPAIAYDTPIAREVLGQHGRFFSDSRSFVDRIVELESAEAYEAASAEALAICWPSWDRYTPKVFDQLRAWAEGAEPLPVEIGR